MTVNEFQATLEHPRPPTDLGPLLSALWWDQKGDWTRAHALVDEDESVEGMGVHAYLHRKEGNAANAAYWYSRSGRPPCSLPLPEEAQQLLQTLLPQTS